MSSRLLALSIWVDHGALYWAGEPWRQSRSGDTVSWEFNGRRLSDIQVGREIGSCGLEEVLAGVVSRSTSTRATELRVFRGSL